MMKRKRVMLLLLACCLYPPVQSQTKEASEQIAQRIQAVENSLVEFVQGPPSAAQQTSKVTNLTDRMRLHKIPGVSIAVINDNATEWAKGYGLIKAGDPASVTTEALFEAASTSKLITAVIVLHCVEEGKLTLDENVNKYLKSWKVGDNEYTKDKKVTLRLLLTHQSGLPATNYPFDETKGIPTLLQVLRGELPAQNKPAVVAFVPGSKWQYSNIGYNVIQLVLEDVLGKPFHQIAREVLFEPLGMKSSSFLYPLKPGEREREALPHDEKGTVCEPAMHPSAVAQGGLMTTPSDLARLTIELMLAYQGKSSRILSKKMVDQMFHRELDLDPKIFGVPASEGLGVFLQGKGREFSFAHPGSNYPGSTSFLIGYPELGKGAIIMTNGVMGEVLALEILPALTKVYGWPMTR
jgi:CubicO group peptidase (beta-lactamase class C family)